MIYAGQENGFKLIRIERALKEEELKAIKQQGFKRIGNYRIMIKR